MLHNIRFKVQNLHSPPKSTENILNFFKLCSTTRREEWQMKEGNTEENKKAKGNVGKGIVIWRKRILAKNNFDLNGDAKWERDCYVDIMGVHVCACKVKREKNGEETKGRKAKKKSLNASLVMGRNS